MEVDLQAGEGVLRDSVGQVLEGNQMVEISYHEGVIDCQVGRGSETVGLPEVLGLADGRLVGDNSIERDMIVIFEQLKGRIKKENFNQNNLPVETGNLDSGSLVDLQAIG